MQPFTLVNDTIRVDATSLTPIPTNIFDSDADSTYLILANFLDSNQFHPQYDVFNSDSVLSFKNTIEKWLNKN